MLESLSLRTRLALATVVVVVVALVVCSVVVVARSHSGKGSPQGRQNPVIVLPGYGGGLTEMGPAVAALRAAGREVVLFHPTGREFGDLRVQAKLLRGLVTRTLRSSKSTSVDVVAFSAGGIIARLWARDYGGAGVARRVLTVSSPHHGTSRATLAAVLNGDCPTACVQLSDGSDLLSHLNAGDETPAGPEWITIRSSTDGLVLPIESASLSGAVNLLVQSGCPAATTVHAAMPYDPYVMAALKSALGTGPPKAPTDVRC